MKLLWLIPLVIMIAGAHGDVLHFRKKLLDTFNEARRILASGTMNPLIDLVNLPLAAVGLKLPNFGPASNMHKLRWSRHLEQHAFLHMEEHGFDTKYALTSFDKNGLVGFTWSGSIIELVQKLTNLIPDEKVRLVLEGALEIIDVLVACLLLVYKYPTDIPAPKNHNYGATHALFAHRYEIGCYSKLLYTICMMENSTNGERLYIEGVPCSNCIGYCEFSEKENGVIEEGDLCEAPKNSTADYVATFSPLLTTTQPMKILTITVFNYHFSILFDRIMKCLSISFIFLLLVIETTSNGTTILQFRKKTLNTFNAARRMIASGDMRKVLEVFERVIPSSLDGTFRGILDYLGPATKMYKMVWSRQLELASFEYSKDKGKSLKRQQIRTGSPTTLFYKDYIGFYWMGDIMNIIKFFVNFIPEGEFRDKAKGAFDFLEALIMFIWIAYSLPAPGSILKKGEYYGPAELMYGERYEIGCHTNWIYSICFVKKLEYREKFFEVGVSCFKCPGQCEFWYSEEDGEIEEGDLCVPPKDVYSQQIAEAQSVTEINDSMYFSVMIPIILVLIYYLRR